MFAIRSIPQRSYATVAATLCVAALLVTDAPRWQESFARQVADPAQAAANWIEENLPDGSMVVSEAYGPRILSPLTAPTADEMARAQAGEPLKKYWLVPVPMFQVQPERSSVYYDPSLYESADAWVVSFAVASRYRSEPERYAAQTAFYGWLEQHWANVATFGSGESGAAQIVIFRNPAQTQPFGSRIAPPPALTQAMRASGGADGESTFYFNLGGNYLEYGHPREAETCFEVALSFPTIAGGVTRDRLLGALRMAKAASP